MNVMNVHIDEKVISFVVDADVGFTPCHCLGLCFVCSDLLCSLLSVGR